MSMHLEMGIEYWPDTVQKEVMKKRERDVKCNEKNKFLPTIKT